MAKLNATECDLLAFRDGVLPSISPENMELTKRLLDAVELGLRSFDTVKSIRPLVAAVWQGMCERNDLNRFAVEAMIRDIDLLLGFWIVDGERKTTVRG